MQARELQEGARRVISICAAVRPHEQVLVITDTVASPAVAQELFAAAQDAGARVSLMVIDWGNTPTMEPYPMVAQAMKAADVILAPTSRTLYHSEATVAAIGNGARFLALTRMDEKTLAGPAFLAEFEAQAPIAEAVAQRMTRGRRMEIRAPGGTILEASTEGRPGSAVTGLCRGAGIRMGTPVIEANVSPLEGSAEGIVVVDASISVVGIVSEPVTLTVQHGVITRIGGGEAADIHRKVLQGVGQAEAFTLAEVAIGLNPNARIVGNVIEDEGKYGTGHVGIGNNLVMGGRVAVPIHIDCVYWHPTLRTDGEIIMADGVLCAL